MQHIHAPPLQKKSQMVRLSELFVTFLFYFCPDDDECSNNDDCDSNAKCSQSIGGLKCGCNQGWTGDGKSCTGKISNKNIFK